MKQSGARASFVAPTSVRVSVGAAAASSPRHAPSGFAGPPRSRRRFARPVEGS